ncbi:uncharacterized protein LOC109534345 isoform X2 [Dendroctonus ponderosae]|nr:uncharacterized protein LOC109534345 isoform X2 [Dendroctonus ponderosae]XP_048525043.1 uncharacterized protein LOC109534345 isoform X2 [Dendroctonus ponderosae]XP_048525044.1 uncharacterized protein LOC109534345 isoform X2 [Dendroctonus ponderosae]XP_048525046.1 uncharacterized protein LOC109534345 isoform X2 [Dendroctonus ponderosae]
MGSLPWEGRRDLVFPRCLLAPLATPFYRFLARFSGRRRTTISYHKKYPPPWPFLVLQLVLISSLVSIVESCSSRSTPKPRPPAPTPRPNITFLTYPCPPAYAAWFCLNGATCFTVKIQDSLLYNCMCADGYQGSRCEYKDLDGSYMPSQRRFMLETASIAGGATIAVFSAVILCLAAYLRWRRRKKGGAATDEVDGLPRNHHRQPIFGVRPQGQNLVPIRTSTLNPFRGHPGNNHAVPGPGSTTVPPLEPNLLPDSDRPYSGNEGTPHDRGDHPATLLRGEPPWGV